MSRIIVVVCGWLVGLTCQFEVAKAREIERRDRPAGICELQPAIDASLLVPDVSIDTTALTPTEVAAELLMRCSAVQPQAFLRVNAIATRS